MSDETKPARKRRLFQVHLSTAIILMFAAGGIYWFEFYATTQRIGVLRIQKGWPISFWDAGEESYSVDDGHRTSYRVRPLQGSGWQLNGVVIDLFCMVMFLTVITFACEWWIRRREMRKKP